MSNQYQKEFDSFSKRVGKFSSWFDALDKDKRWQLLFDWKKYKWTTKQFGKSASLKAFLYRKRKSTTYFVSNQKIREQKLNKLIN